MLQVPNDARMILKGTKSFVDAYSCFFDNMKQVTYKEILLLTKYKTNDQNETSLNKDLRKGGIQDVFICGLCTDICVGKKLAEKKKQMKMQLALSQEKCWDA